MKNQLFLCVLFLAHMPVLQAQNVGIGTNSPTKLLTVNGSILIDPQNTNPGTVDSAALLFGTTSKVGISAAKMGGTASNQNGLTLWTNNLPRLSISSNGNIGINDQSPSYLLDVNGSMRATGTIYANSNLLVDGFFYANNNAYLYNNLYVADYVGIGVTPSSSYKMNVNGNLLVQTNLGVDGTARIDGKITNEGKGIMLSNSSTTLRSGFTSCSFSLTLAAGSYADVTFYVTPFTGSNANIRVMVGQFAPGSGASNYGGVLFTAHDPLDTDPNYNNGSTIKIRMQNVSSSSANLGSNAVLYLYSVVTD